jgi:hypothetical protein
MITVVEIIAQVFNAFMQIVGYSLKNQWRNNCNGL